MHPLDAARQTLVPLFARVLLFLAFVPIGWHHAMEHAVFTGEQATRLRDLGIAAAASDGPWVALAGLQDDATIAGMEPSWSPGDVEARALHELTLALDRLGVPSPEIGAWVLTVFELVGGALLLLGLFTRLWAMGLLAWLVVVFALSSWPEIRGTWFFTTPEPALSRAMSQLSLAVLAMLLASGGAGRLSLDGQIFRRAAAVDDEDDDE